MTVVDAAFRREYFHNQGLDELSSEERPYCWLAEQPDCGATQLYMVCMSWGWGQTILAEKCYAKYGKLIVDALRASKLSWSDA